MAAVHTNAVTDSIASMAASGKWEYRFVFLTDLETPYVARGGVHTVNFVPKSFRNHASSRQYRQQWSLRYLQQVLVNPPGLLGFFGSGSSFAYAVAMACLLRRVPYFVIAGDIGIRHSRFQQFFFAKARQVLVHTLWHKEMLVREKGVSAHNLTVFPIGVDTSLFSPGTNGPRGAATEYPRLIYVGRLVPYKGAFGAVQAFSQIKCRWPNATLDVLGPQVDGDYMAKMRRYCSEQELSDSVRFPGVVAHNELPAWFRDADMMIYPSTSDSFGMVVVESMACGTPVAALRGSGGPEDIISDGVDGLVVSEDEIAERVLAVLGESRLLQEMGEAARRKVLQQYSAERTLLQLRSIFDDIEGQRTGIVFGAQTE